MKEAYAEKDIHLKDYLWVIYKRRWIIIAFFLTLVAVVTIHSFIAIPIYRATTQILIEKESPNILDVKEIYAVDTTTQDFYQTQYKILETPFLARKVIKKLKPKFTSESKEDKFSIYNTIFFWKTEEVSSDEMEEVVLDFLKQVKVEPIRNTRLAKIHFDSKDPELAALVANTIINTYIEHNMETKIDSIHGATDFLNKKLDEQRKKLEYSELALHKYKERNNILSLKEKENITVSKLAELNSDVLKAENKRVEAETRYKQAEKIQDNPELIESIPQVLANPFITRLKTDEATLSKKLSELSKKFGKKHPRIIILEEKLKTTRSKLRKEIKKVVSLLKNEYEVFLASERTLKKALKELKDEAQLLSKRAIVYNVLLRDVETNKQLYDILLTRLKETGVAGGIQSTLVKVIDEAKVPNKPIKPRKRLNILLSIIVGIFGGIGLAFFFEYFDNTVKTPDDIKRYVQIPYFGPVPSYKNEMEISPLVTLKSTKSTASEAYRSIRTNILFSSSEKTQKVLLITSSNVGEGKTLTVSNLAVVMAQAGSSVLIIDGDLRKPRIHNIFGFPREEGLTNLLVGTSELENLIRKTDLPNLDIITCGHIPPNPAEILGSDNMKKNLELLKDRYDKILIDAPPVMPVTDAVILSTLADEILLVIQAGRTSRDVIGRSIEQLRDVNAHLLGAVLNNIEVGRDSYYYYQYYYYQYGEDGGKKKSRKKHQSV